jgi:hypothetical protein
MSCIICCDNGGDLIPNNECPCNYVRHAHCWMEYLRHTDPLKCPVCRGKLEISYLKPHPPTPTRSVQTTPVRQEGQEISYEEFVDIITVANQSAVGVQPQHHQQQTQRQPKNKLFGFLVLLGLIAFVVILFKVFF